MEPPRSGEQHSVSAAGTQENPRDRNGASGRHAMQACLFTQLYPKLEGCLNYLDGAIVCCTAIFAYIV